MTEELKRRLDEINEDFDLPLEEEDIMVRVVIPPLAYELPLKDYVRLNNMQ